MMRDERIPPRKVHRTWKQRKIRAYRIDIYAKVPFETDIYYDSDQRSSYTGANSPITWLTVGIGYLVFRAEILYANLFTWLFYAIPYSRKKQTYTRSEIQDFIISANQLGEYILDYFNRTIPEQTWLGWVLETGDILPWLTYFCVGIATIGYVLENNHGLFVQMMDFYQERFLGEVVSDCFHHDTRSLFEAENDFFEVYDKAWVFSIITGILWFIDFFPLYGAFFIWFWLVSVEFFVVDYVRYRVTQEEYEIRQEAKRTFGPIIAVAYINKVLRLDDGEIVMMNTFNDFRRMAELTLKMLLIRIKESKTWTIFIKFVKLGSPFINYAIPKLVDSWVDSYQTLITIRPLLGMLWNKLGYFPIDAKLPEITGIAHMRQTINNFFLRFHHIIEGFHDYGTGRGLTESELFNESAIKRYSRTIAKYIYWTLFPLDLHSQYYTKSNPEFVEEVNQVIMEELWATSETGKKAKLDFFFWVIGDRDPEELLMYTVFLLYITPILQIYTILTFLYVIIYGPRIFAECNTAPQLCFEILPNFEYPYPSLGIFGWTWFLDLLNSEFYFDDESEIGISIKSEIDYKTAWKIPLDVFGDYLKLTFYMVLYAWHDFEEYITDPYDWEFFANHASYMYKPWHKNRMFTLKYENPHEIIRNQDWADYLEQYKYIRQKKKILWTIIRYLNAEWQNFLTYPYLDVPRIAWQNGLDFFKSIQEWILRKKSD